MVTTDPQIQAKCEEVARSRGQVLLPSKSANMLADIPAPAAYVIDLKVQGALEAISKAKQTHPATPLAAVMSLPDQMLWRQAEAAGADIVLTRGTLHRQLPGFLESYSSRPLHRRIRVGPANEFEGRLGFLWLIEEGTDGAPEDIALFRVGYGFHAVTDRCPHAQVSLHSGDLAGPTITCPGHGSQFDVTTGQRTRGPSDLGLTTYPVIVEDGSVFVQID